MISQKRYTPVENEGVYTVARIFNRDFRWIFREQPKADVGIDAHVEVCDAGKPTGKLLALQIKSGESWFDETVEEGIVYRGTLTHLEYWLDHSLPVLILLYSPATEQVYWQIVLKDYVIRTSKAWKIVVPYSQALNKSSTDVLREYSVNMRTKDALYPRVPYCIRMQEVITHLTEKHGVDLRADHAYLQLEQRGFDPLTIEKLDAHLVSVSHYFVQNHDIVYDPSVEFFIDYYAPGEDWYYWTPVSITSFANAYFDDYYKSCARIEGDSLVVTDSELQRDIAHYVEGWARRIRQNRWVELGRVTGGGRESNYYYDSSKQL
jgi:hypothetical protein